MKLLTVSEEDLDLRVRIESDPIMMAELGGPISRERIRQAHYKSLDAINEGTCWWFKIIPDDVAAPGGLIGIWRSSWHGLSINEMGWMVLPEFQGRGLASRAGHEILLRAREERKFEVVHAFPGVGNISSNKICENLGFSLIDQCDIDYQDRSLPANHWQLRVF